MLCCDHINQYHLLLGLYFFPNSDKHFPDTFIDKLGLFCSFHAPDFSCSICLAF